jgi:hypothetical protein
MVQQPLVAGPGPLYWGFTITPRHATLGRTPLDEWSARHRDLYLTTHNTHKTQTSMPPAGLESTIPASVRLEIHALKRAATGIVNNDLYIPYVFLVKHNLAPMQKYWDYWIYAYWWALSLIQSCIWYLKSWHGRGEQKINLQTCCIQASHSHRQSFAPNPSPLPCSNQHERRKVLPLVRSNTQSHTNRAAERNSLLFVWKVAWCLQVLFTTLTPCQKAIGAVCLQPDRREGRSVVMVTHRTSSRRDNELQPKLCCLGFIKQKHRVTAEMTILLYVESSYSSRLELCPGLQLFRHQGDARHVFAKTSLCNRVVWSLFTRSSLFELLKIFLRKIYDLKKEMKGI